MSDVTKATVRADSDRLVRMIQEAAAKPTSGTALHSEVYIRISEDEVELLASTTDDYAVSYSTFNAAYFESVGIIRANSTKKDREEVEAIINISDFLSYLSMSADGYDGIIEMTFIGEENYRLCHALRFEAAILTEVMLPAAESNIEEVSLDALEQSNDEIYSSLRHDGGTMETTIEIDAREIKQLMDFVHDYQYPKHHIANADAGAIYPVTIQGGALMITIAGGGSRQDAVYGEFNTEIVDGPDLSNTYHLGFEPVFSTLSGKVRLNTGQDMPLCVVQRGDSHTVRHALRSFSLQDGWGPC